MHRCYEGYIGPNPILTSYQYLTKPIKKLLYGKVELYFEKPYRDQLDIDRMLCDQKREKCANIGTKNNNKSQ